MSRKVKKSSVPPNECNEWGHPNDLWEFCGYDHKKESSMWRRKEKNDRNRKGHWA